MSLDGGRPRAGSTRGRGRRGDRSSLKKLLTCMIRVPGTLSLLCKASPIEERLCAESRAQVWPIGDAAASGKIEAEKAREDKTAGMAVSDKFRSYR